MCGTIHRVPKMSFPEHCVQAWISEGWWVKSGSNSLRRGTLVRAFVPYVGGRQELVPTARSSPTEHRRLDAELQGFHLSKKHRAPNPPCASFPYFPSERSAVQRGKIRPALVVSDLARYQERKETASWIKKPSVLIAPYFGADPDGRRAGWPACLVNAIEHYKLPQYLSDSLPIGGPAKSILRLDQIQPLENSSNEFRFTGWELSEEAVNILDEWVFWYRTGCLDPEGPLYQLVQLYALD